MVVHNIFLSQTWDSTQVHNFISTSTSSNTAIHCVTPANLLPCNRTNSSVKHQTFQLIQPVQLPRSKFSTTTTKTFKTITAKFQLCHPIYQTHHQKITIQNICNHNWQCNKKFVLRKSTNKLNKIKLRKKKWKQRMIYQISCRLYRLSRIFWRASPHQIDARRNPGSHRKQASFYPSAKSKLRNPFARDLQRNARKKQVVIADRYRWDRRKNLGLDGSQVEEEGSEVDLMLGGRIGT